MLVLADQIQPSFRSITFFTVFIHQKLGLIFYASSAWPNRPIGGHREGPGQSIQVKQHCEALWSSQPHRDDPYALRRRRKARRPSRQTANKYRLREGGRQCAGQRERSPLAGGRRRRCALDLARNPPTPPPLPPPRRRRRRAAPRRAAWHFPRWPYLRLGGWGCTRPGQGTLRGSDRCVTVPSMTSMRPPALAREAGRLAGPGLAHSLRSERCNHAASARGYGRRVAAQNHPP